MNSVDSGQVWYYYDVPEPAPRQNTNKPVSQIPVLNGVLHEDVEQPQPRRGGEDINSKYIKIAKAGGRKDLLLYSENPPKEEMKEYERTDWFDHPDPAADLTVGKPRQRPEVKRFKIQRGKQITMLQSEAPFNTDEFLQVWNESQGGEENRDQYLTRQAQKQKQLNKLNLPPMLLPKPRPAPDSVNKKINKPPLGENNEPISFSHLLSHGYQADWSRYNTETRKQKMEMKRKDEKEQKEKLTKHLESYKKDNQTNPDKTQFKMKKFANVPSRIVNS